MVAVGGMVIARRGGSLARSLRRAGKLRTPASGRERRLLLLTAQGALHPAPRGITHPCRISLLPLPAGHPETSAENGLVPGHSHPGFHDSSLAFAAVNSASVST
jgi:hypothetical protein